MILRKELSKMEINGEGFITHVLGDLSNFLKNLDGHNQEINAYLIMVICLMNEQMIHLHK